MKNPSLWISLFLSMGVFLSPVWAKVPLVQATATPAPTAVSPDQDQDDLEDEAPFHSYLENTFQLGSSGQQAGQTTGFFGYTGTLHLSEEGHFLSAGLQTTRQKVEGVAASTASLVVGGGLGLGFFSPSVSVALGGGDKDWKQIGGNLNLAFQLWDPFAIILSPGGTLGSHGGLASELSPSLSGLIAINTNSAYSSLGFIFIPWDWFSIYPSIGYQVDGSSITYKGVTYTLNKSDQIATFSMALDLTLFKGFVLELAPQVGQEFYPAGISYSPEAGGLVNNANPYTQNFVGGSGSISYSFE